jgi:hypothetical protein
MESGLTDIWKRFREESFERAEVFALNAITHNKTEKQLEVWVSKGNYAGVLRALDNKVKEADLEKAIVANLFHGEYNSGKRYKILEKLIDYHSKLGKNPLNINYLAKAVRFRQGGQYQILARHLWDRGVKKCNLLPELRSLDPIQEPELFRVVVSSKFYCKKWNDPLLKNAAYLNNYKAMEIFCSLGADPCERGLHGPLQILESHRRLQANKAKYSILHKKPNHKNIKDFLKLYTPQQLSDVLRKPSLGLEDETIRIVKTMLTKKITNKVKKQLDIREDYLC